ncbi:MAG: TRAP transporter small permease [Alphaproteobacteria bacterium]|nr:TRAP transporter small permease [Alphaproteobacteria bacterium]
MRRWRSLTAGLCGGLAALALVGMMMLTVVDVVLRAVANRPIRGTFELIELLLACTFFLALPAAFLRDEHIVVDLVDQVAGKRVILLKRLAELLAIVVIAVMAWQGWQVARDTLLFGDITSDLELPRIWYWVPVLAGLIGSGIAAAAMAIRPDAERHERSQ